MKASSNVRLKTSRPGMSPSPICRKPMPARRSTTAGRSSREEITTSMSRIGFAASPATDVLPTCSIASARGPSASASIARISRNCASQSEVQGSTRTWPRIFGSMGQRPPPSTARARYAATSATSASGSGFACGNCTAPFVQVSPSAA